MTNQSVNEIIGDGVRKHSFDVLRSSITLQRKIVSMLNKMEAGLLAKLMRQTPSTLNKKRRMQEFLAAASEEIQSFYRTAGDKVYNELVELAEIEYNFSTNNINDAVGVGLTDTYITRKQAEALVKKSLIQGAPSADWWSRQSANTANLFKDQVRLGILQGDNIAQLAQRIKGGVRDGQVIPGVPNVPGVTSPGRGFIKRATKNAKALVRTSYMQVADDARMAMYNDNANILKGIQQISTLDSRTTPVCVAYSGATWNMQKQPIDGNKLPYGSGVPRHWNCRSVEAPLLKSFSELSGIKGLPDIPETTRSSIDGQIPVDTTFQTWLGGKNKAFQEKLLGKGKAKLFREGKIGLVDLVDSETGAPLTLAELKASI